jgi:lysozyme
MPNLTPSGVALSLIREFEGVKLKPYLCPAKIWTIGVGHVMNAEERRAFANGITEAQSSQLLMGDLQRFADFLNGLNLTLKQPQFDALVSLTFNIGTGAFAKSTLLKKLRAADNAEAADQFLAWNKVKGKPVAGLTRRRKAERSLFLSEEGARS